MAELLRSTSKPALVKNSSFGSQRRPGRHVAFEVPSQQRRSGLSDIDSEVEQLRGRQRSCCFACCVWTCIVIFTLIIIFLIVGISYIAFLQAGMPQVFVRRMNITKLQVDNSDKMDSAIQLLLRFSNKNEKLNLLYGPLKVDVNSQDVQLGNTRVAGFSQKPQNDTDLDMKMTINKAEVDSDAVNEMRSDMKANEMVFNVYVSGKIGFKVGSMSMTTVPFLSTCLEVQLTDVNFGRRPQCDVKMFSFRPSSN